LPIRDIHEYPIINHFEEANEFIDKARTNKINVLVHCHAGVSRSASIVCAYLIKSKRWSPSQALEYVKQKRERAKPNISFWHQLNHYFTNLNKSTLLESKYDKESLILKENNVPGE
jgi:protein-tyrosine phosphatase